MFDALYLINVFLINLRTTIVLFLLSVSRYVYATPLKGRELAQHATQMSVWQFWGLLIAFYICCLRKRSAKRELKTK